MGKPVKSVGKSITGTSVMFAAVSISALVLFYSSLSYSGEFVEMEISGITFENNHAIILLKGNCHEFSLYVPKEEGESMMLMLENSAGAERRVPLTMRIIEKDSEYLGEIVTSEMLQLKVRTGINEAILLAMESGSPIYIRRSLATNTCK